MGRCLSEKAGSIVNNFAYNSGGNLKSSSNGNVTQNYTYNNLGKIATEYTSTAGGHTITRSYDNWGRNTQNVYKKESSTYKTQKYSYDELSRLKSISSEGDNSTKYTANYTYDNNSNITKAAGNNCTITYEYNKANLMTKITNSGLGSNYISYSYDYYIDGNVMSVTDVNGNETIYSYDNGNRLIGEANNKGGGISFVSSYVYDSLGNRVSMNYKENGSNKYSIEYAYDKNSRLVSEKKSMAGNSEAYNMTEYGYDNNGNMLSKVWYNRNTSGKYELNINDVNAGESVGYEFFSYDMLNELTEYEDTKGNKGTYLYLPNHYRMSKNVNGTITQHIWDGDNIVAEANSSNAIIRSYVRGHELLTDDERRAYMYDGHGNMVQQVKGFNVESKMRYDAYGNVKESANVNDTPFGYCGEYTDDESGFVYLRNRYYDTSTGRFITEDPIRDGVNWYAYCNNNPIVFVDPSGLSLGIKDYKNLGNDVKSRIKSDIQTISGAEIDISNYGEVKFKNPTVISSKEKGYSLVESLINYDGAIMINMQKGTKNGLSSSFGVEEESPLTTDSDGNAYQNYEINYYYESEYWVHAVDSKDMWFWQKKPGFIGLAHEFVHGYRAINGIYDINKTTSYVAPTTGQIYDAKYTTKGKSYKVGREEFETVGLIPWENKNVISITENDIRKENNYSNRAWYFGSVY